MIPKPKHDIYLTTWDGRFVKIAWLYEFKDFELMIGFYGLDGGDPFLAYQYIDRVLTIEELKSFKIPHKEAVSKWNFPVDHFTLHGDKGHRSGVFHMKDRKRAPHNVLWINGNINKGSWVILDFFIISDLISMYQKSETVPDDTDIVFWIHEDALIAIRWQYSGIDFDIEKEIAKQATILGLKTISTIWYCDRMLKWYLTYESIRPEKKFMENKNVGTYFSVLFPVKDNKFLVRTFIFS